MTELPPELHRQLALHCPYSTLQKVRTVLSPYWQICADPIFWQERIEREFPHENFKEIMEETGSSEVAYIRLAAEANIPYIGAEKYSNIRELGKAAARTDDYGLIKYFYSLIDNTSKMLYILAKRGKSEWLAELYGEEDDGGYIVNGALAGGNLELAKYYLTFFPDVDVSVLRDSVKSGNLEIVRFSKNLVPSEKSLCPIACALAVAIKHGYQDIIDYLMPQCNDFLHPPMYEAAKLSPVCWELINKLIDKLITGQDYQDFWNSGLAGAGKGGNLQLVKFMISNGANDLNMCMCKAASRGHLSILEYLHDRGAYFTGVLDQAIIYNQKSAVEYLLKIYEDYDEAIDGAIDTILETDNCSMFHLFNEHNKIRIDNIPKYIDQAKSRGSIKILRKLLTHWTPDINIPFIDTKQLNITIILCEYQIKCLGARFSPILRDQFYNHFNIKPRLCNSS